VKLQREADERVEAARRRAEQEVNEKVERARSDALGRSEEIDDETVVQLPEPAAPGDPSGTRYVGGRRLRTF